MTSSARRALRILEVVNSSRQPMGVTAIAEATGTPPGTAFRSLDALENCDFVARYRASTQYQIGAAASRLTRSLYARFYLINICLPYLRRLAYASSETTSLMVPVGGYGVRIAVVAGTRSVRSAAALGISGLLDRDVAGRAILAFYSAGELANWLTHSGKRKSGKLNTDLDDIRRSGYAMDKLNDKSQRVGIAIPIQVEGHAIAAVALDGPVADLERGPDNADLANWQQIIAEIQSHLSQIPLAKLNPFAFLDPRKVAKAFAGFEER